MVKNEKDARYRCDECGVVVVVDEPCGCAPCDLVCCGVPMAEVAPKTKARTKSKRKK